MTKFVYTAEKSDGEIYKGIADAADRFELYGVVRREGGKIISVGEDARNNMMSIGYWNAKLTSVKEMDKILMARNLGAKLFTNDYNLGKIAELQKVHCVNMHDLAKSMKSILLPGEMLTLRIVREGKDKGQGIGYMPDGTMVVVNNGHSHIGQQVEVQVQSLLQTGAGVIVFADLRIPSGIAS